VRETPDWLTFGMLRSQWHL